MRASTLSSRSGPLGLPTRMTLQFRFSEEYPIRSPEVVFVGPSPENDHVYSNGHVCLSILYDEWAPSYTVESVCVSILSMLSAARAKGRPAGDAEYSRTAQSPQATSWSYHGTRHFGPGVGGLAQVDNC